MEQWQFLIQKQGERAWQPLESAYAEIVEGRYRIVASSLSINTDVEVRVIHQSPSEIPPRRRIHKRLRRTNSEGLTAVIPFTYFAPGIWEIRCSGDLMSDILGTSWQHNLRLQVLPLVATTEISPSKNDADGNIVSVLPIPPAPPNFKAAIDESKLADTPENQLAASANVDNSELADELSNSNNITSTERVINQLLQQASEETNLSSTDSNQLEQLQTSHVEISAPNNQVIIEAPANTENINTESINTVDITEEIIEPSQNVVQDTLSTSVESENLLLNNANTQNPAVDQSEQSLDVTEITETIAQKYDTNNLNNTDTIIDEPISLSINNFALQVRHDEVEAIADQPVNPVWVKGDTAEQILQNLIELALPSTDPLLEVVKESQTEQPLPLLLILDQQSYVAQWGRPLTVCGQVKLREAVNNKDDTSEFESVGSSELKVELRSPLGLEILTQQQQYLNEKLLPFGFDFTIEIPVNCESKLILADIYLYGALSSLGDSILLASQSFTITADVTELLAVSITAKPSEPDMLDDPQPKLTPEPEKPPVSIDLELFNLVKTAKTTPLVTRPSPKRALPLRIDEPRHAKSANTSLLLLPQSTSLPFLKKRQAPSVEETVSSTFVEEENLGLEELELEIINSLNSTDDLEPGDQVPIEKMENEDVPQFEQEQIQRVTLPENTTIVAKPYVSPLIQKWMQSQGYSISETLNFASQTRDTSTVSQALSNTVSIANEDVTDSTNDENNLSDVTHEGAEKPESSTFESETSEDQHVDTQVPLSTVLEDETPYAGFAQEIVIDDTFDENSAHLDTSTLYEAITSEESIANILSTLPFQLRDIELLPVPQINLPSHELISGSTIRVRILLKEMRPNTAIKLWVEDCQTRWLLEGPHILKDLYPNPFAQGLEVVTELNIPFGCVEIRIEAVSFDLASQQESDKASIQITVVPPDLPVLHFDEVLGI